MSKKLKESFFGNTTIQEVIGELSAPEQLEKVRIYDLDTDEVLFEGRSVDIPKKLLGRSLEGVFIFDAEFVVSSGANKKEMWESKLANLSDKSLTEAYSDMGSAITADGTKVMAVGSTRHTRTYNYEDVTFRFGNKEGKGTYRWQNRPWQRFDFADALIDAMKSAGIEDAFARECIKNTNSLDSAVEYFAKNYKKQGPQSANESKKLKESVSGWIAMLDGKKVEIRKGEADSLYGAKKLAIKKFGELFGRPLSKAKELQVAIEPAYDDEELEKAPASNVQFESKQSIDGMDESKKSGQSYSEKELLDAVIDAYGFTKTKAFEYIKNASEKTKQELVKGFKQNAKKDFYENKQLKESPVYDLSTQHDSRQSFYGKARIDVSDDAQVETLISYNTPVARISGGKVELLPAWNTSATTLRHVKEFLKQHGFKAESSAQIAKDYGAKNEFTVTEANKTNWKEKVEVKTENGKIVKYINNKPDKNDSVDYYVLFDKEGNHVDKNVNFDVLKKKLDSLKPIVKESKEEIVVNCPDMSLQEIKDYCEVWQCDAINTGVKGKYKLVGKDAEVAREELKADGHIQESADVKEQIQQIEKEFKIEYWATEEDREEGFGDIFIDTFTDKEEAIAVAKKMVDRDGIASVEVIDENDVTVFGYDGAETWNESKQVKQEPKKVIENKKTVSVKNNEAKKLDENLKIISDLSQYHPWAGAVDTWDKIEDANLIDALDSMLEDLYPEGLTATELNDILWFDSEMILEQLGIAEPEDEEEEDEDEDTND